MSGKRVSETGAGRRSARRAATTDEIVGAAWTLAAEQGLAGITMRDLGARVDMRAQSLYSYFDSKLDIYDAMFEQGYRAFAEWMTPEHDESASARDQAHRYFAFCVADPVRFQLLFQRTVPGFEPSERSYKVAVEVLESATEQLASLGITGRDRVDMWTAVLTGLASQQIANDPGGTRWQALVDDAVDMLLAHTTSTPPAARRPSPTTRSTVTRSTATRSTPTRSTRRSTR